MTANEYRAKAERFREAARKLWTGSEDRDVLLKFARAYDLLTKATETLAKPPIG